MKRLQDKVALLTGGTGGIGIKTAELMLQEGAKVVLVGQSQESLDEAKSSLEGLGELTSVVADASKEEDVKNYVQEALDAYGKIDIFFNNAGILGDAYAITETPAEEFDKVIAVNVRGVFLGMKHVLQAMKKQGKGSVINTSSIDGLSASPQHIPYVASKHAVVGMTKTAAVEMAEFGIRVNSIHPGYTETDMMRESESGRGDDLEAAKKEITEGVPYGRYGKPEEVARLVIFLGSDDSEYITGAQIPIDGGVLAK